MSQFIEIGYGVDELQVEVMSEVAVEKLGGGHGVVDARSGRGATELDAEVAEVQAKVVEALAKPEQFLPIAEMLVPGDSLAIALDCELPHAGAIVAGVLQAIDGCRLGKIEVVVSDSLAPSTVEGLRKSLPQSVELTLHRIADRGSQMYLAADEDAEPIRLNRSLGDADMVLPISVMRVTDPLVGGPSSDVLFPGLGDDSQLKRLQRSTFRAIEKREHYRNDWAAGQADQVRWALGVQMMLAVEVTCGGRVGRVIASTPEALRESVRSHYQAVRGGGEQEAFDVVIACVEGDQSQQTVENLTRAALVARGLASPSGSVVLVTDRTSLGRAGTAENHFDEGGWGDGDSVDQADTEQVDAEAGEASGVVPSQAAFARKLLSELINQIDTTRRYLLWSGCEPEAAEAFGFGVIGDGAALARLVSLHGSCCVVRAAQTASDAGVLTSSSARS
jgi:hypothetical protein